MPLPADGPDPRVFISYRSEDSGPTASWLFEALSEAYGAERIFIDHERLEGGDVWPERLEAEPRRASVMLVLIGKGWLGAHDPETGVRRIDQEGDWVRKEIETALGTGARVVPLLVEGANPVTRQAFATVPSLAPLADRQSRTLRRKDWKSDLGRLHELLAANGFARQQPDDIPLHLPPADFAAHGLLRFSFKNGRIPFRGREQELAALEDFLSHPRPFAWWLAVGGGGAGKSRLALELCLRQRGRWQAGFLELPSTQQRWDVATVRSWQPRQPTLIVIDYVLARPKQTRDLILALARRAERLTHPVRLILLERKVDARFIQELYPSTSDAGEMNAKLYPDGCLAPLIIPSLSDDEVWELAREFARVTVGEHAGLSLDRATFFARLNRIDHRRRALSAIILAEALALGGARQQFGSLEKELQDLLRRDRDNHWPRVQGECAIRDDVEKPILALATMIGGLRKHHLADLPPEARQLTKACRMADCAQVVGCEIDEKDPTLAPIEPDLLGEFYVLEALSPKNAFADEPELAWLPKVAWGIDNGVEMAGFADRVYQNFPEHKSLEALYVVRRGSVASRSARSGRLLREHGSDLSAAAQAMWQDLDEDLADDWSARIVLGMLASWATMVAVDQKLLEDLMAKLFELAKQYAEETDLRTFWARGVSNLTMTDPQVARPLFDELTILARGYPDESVLREAWAASVVNLVSKTSEADPKAARHLLRQLLVVARAHRGEHRLRHAFAMGVHNLMNTTAGTEPAPARYYLDRLEALALEFLEEPEIREWWANSVTNFTNQTAAAIPEEARDLLARLSELSKAHPDEPILRDAWAKSLYNTIMRDAVVEPQAGRLLNCLLVAIQANPNEPTLREEWAKGAVYLITTVAELETRHDLLGRLDSLAQDHPGEAVLRKAWARGASNLISQTAAADPRAASVVLNQLETVAQTHLDEPLLREEWAKCVHDFNYFAAASDPSNALDRLTRLYALIEAHPDEPVLRAFWAKSVMSLVRRPSVTELPTARGLLDRLDALAQTYPDEVVLREEWAKGIANLIGRYQFVGRMPEAWAAYPGLTEFARGNDEDAWGNGWLIANLNLRHDSRTEDEELQMLQADLDVLLPKIIGRRDVQELLARFGGAK